MILMVALLFTNSNYLFAAESLDSNNIDMFADNKSEQLSIEGCEYIFTYSYNDDGNKVVEILNLQENTIDEVVYDDSEGDIILNGKCVAEVEENAKSGNFYSSGSVLNSNGAWIKLGSGSHTVTWKEGVTVAVAAAAIAAVLGGVGAGGVIAAMGMGALSALASACIGGTVNATVYQFNSKTICQVKYVWTFRAYTGEKFGPYTNVY